MGTVPGHSMPNLSTDAESQENPAGEQSITVASLGATEPEACSRCSVRSLGCRTA